MEIEMGGVDAADAGCNTNINKIIAASDQHDMLRFYRNMGYIKPELRQYQSSDVDYNGVCLGLVLNWLAEAAKTKSFPQTYFNMLHRTLLGFREVSLDPQRCLDDAKMTELREQMAFVNKISLSNGLKAYGEINQLNFSRTVGAEWMHGQTFAFKKNANLRKIFANLNGKCAVQKGKLYQVTVKNHALGIMQTDAGYYLYDPQHIAEPKPLTLREFCREFSRVVAKYNGKYKWFTLNKIAFGEDVSEVLAMVQQAKRITRPKPIPGLQQLYAEFYAGRVSVASLLRYIELQLQLGRYKSATAISLLQRIKHHLQAETSFADFSPILPSEYKLVLLRRANIDGDYAALYAMIQQGFLGQVDANLKQSLLQEARDFGHTLNHELLRQSFAKLEHVPTKLERFYAWLGDILKRVTEACLEDKPKPEVNLITTKTNSQIELLTAPNFTPGYGSKILAAERHLPKVNVNSAELQPRNNKKNSAKAA